MTYLAVENQRNPVDTMSLFERVSDEELARKMHQAHNRAFKEAGDALEPILLKIARGELPKPREPAPSPQATGCISRFFAQFGL